MSNKSVDEYFNKMRRKDMKSKTAKIKILKRNDLYKC